MTSNNRRALFVGVIAIVLVVIGLLVSSHGRRPVPPMTVVATSQAVERTVVKQHVNRSAPTDDTGTVEICGYGKVPIDENDLTGVANRVASLTRAATARWLSALQDSGELRARVVGLMLCRTGDSKGRHCPGAILFCYRRRWN